MPCQYTDLEDGDRGDRKRSVLSMLCKVASDKCQWSELRNVMYAGVLGDDKAVSAKLHYKISLVADDDGEIKLVITYAGSTDNVGDINTTNELDALVSYRCHHIASHSIARCCFIYAT